MKDANPVTLGPSMPSVAVLVGRVAVVRSGSFQKGGWVSLVPARPVHRGWGVMANSGEGAVTSQRGPGHYGRNSGRALFYSVP